MQTIGDRVRDLRAQKGWSQRELGRLSDVSYAIISRLESGDRQWPSIPMAKRLARTLGVSVDYLVGMYESGNGHHS